MGDRDEMYPFFWLSPYVNIQGYKNAFLVGMQQFIIYWTLAVHVPSQLQTTHLQSTLIRNFKNLLLDDVPWMSPSAWIIWPCLSLLFCCWSMQGEGMEGCCWTHRKLFDWTGSDNLHSSWARRVCWWKSCWSTKQETSLVPKSFLLRQILRR